MYIVWKMHGQVCVIPPTAVLDALILSESMIPSFFCDENLIIVWPSRIYVNIRCEDVWVFLGHLKLVWLRLCCRQDLIVSRSCYWRVVACRKYTCCYYVYGWIFTVTQSAEDCWWFCCEVIGFLFFCALWLKPVCMCMCMSVQGERGPEGPVEEVCGGSTDAEERREPGQWW